MSVWPLSGAEPSYPRWQLWRHRWTRAFWNRAYKENITGLSGMVAYNLMLAVFPFALLVLFVASTALGDEPAPGGRTLTGKDALGDWTTDAPGVRRKITVEDLATPYDTPSASRKTRTRLARLSARNRSPLGARTMTRGSVNLVANSVTSKPSGALGQAPSGLGLTRGKFMAEGVS